MLFILNKIRQMLNIIFKATLYAASPLSDSACL